MCTISTPFWYCCLGVACSFAGSFSGAATIRGSRGVIFHGRGGGSQNKKGIGKGKKWSIDITIPR